MEQGPTTANVTGQIPLQPEVIKPQVPINAANSHMFQINFYRQFFDLDTETFFHKLQRAMNPLDRSFSGESTDENGTDNGPTELYGFIWITGTLIFLMFVSSTGSNIISSWIHSDGKDPSEKYEYKFDLLTLSVSLFYGYNLIVPVGLYAFTSWILKFPHKLPLLELISIYGYTNILWIPITVVNFVIAILVSQKHNLMLNIIEWTIVVLSGFITGASNLSKLSPIIQRNCLLLAEADNIDSKKLHFILVGILAFLHLCFTVLVKICFFGFD